MQMRLYTLHLREGRAVRAVADGFSYPALLVPPLWALWNGLWITLAAYLGLVALAGWWSPLAGFAVEFALAVILGLEGGAVRRAELRLRGWHEAGMAEARTPEGAEELFFSGELT